MRNLITFLILIYSISFFSQNLENQVFILGKDSLNINLLSELIKKEINLNRVNNGLDTLSFSKYLSIGATRNSKKCADKNGLILEHTEKGDFYEVTQYELEGTIGYTFILSQIAKSFVSGWMNSPNHRKILLNKSIKTMGSGVIIKDKIIKRNAYVCDRQTHNNLIVKAIDSKEYYIWVSVRFKN